MLTWTLTLTINQWEVEGRFKRKGTYAYLWMTHDVWQKSTQHCKALILQLKINKINGGGRLKKNINTNNMDRIVSPQNLYVEALPPIWLYLVKRSLKYQSVQFSSVAQSCPTLCDPLNCSMPGLPVHHQLPEFIQTLWNIIKVKWGHKGGALIQ